VASTLLLTARRAFLDGMSQQGHDGPVPVDVRPRTFVARPRREVAAYMFDPEQDLEWTGGITASRTLTPGPLGVGSQVERHARFLGRSFVYRYTVTRADPDSVLEMRVERPFPMTVRYELADAGAGTNVAIRATGSPGRYFFWATPLMSWQVRRSICADLERLRRRLER
jgi:Polyketide cyclase / dehydrase and lipid transport